MISGGLALGGEYQIPRVTPPPSCMNHCKLVHVSRNIASLPDHPPGGEQCREGAGLLQEPHGPEVGPPRGVPGLPGPLPGDGAAAGARPLHRGGEDCR